MSNIIITLAIGETHENLANDLRESLYDHGYTGEFVTLGETNEIEKTDKEIKIPLEYLNNPYVTSDFFFIKKLFSIRKYLTDNYENFSANQKFLYVDADTIALENPDFVFEVFHKNLIFSSILKFDEYEYKKFFYPAMTKLEIESKGYENDIQVLRPNFIGFTIDDSNIFDRAIKIFLQNDFFALGLEDLFYLNLACRLYGLQIINIENIFDRRIVSDSHFSDETEGAVFRHLSYHLLSSK